MSILFSALKRDLMIGMRQRSDLMLPLIFFLIIVSLFPLGLGIEENQLIHLSAPAILWVAALLSTLLTLDRLFKNDFEDGSLEQFIISGHPFYPLVLGKIFAHWILTALPLIVFSPFLGLMLYFDVGQALKVSSILFIGTPLLSFVGAMCVGIVVGLRQAGLLLSIIVLPLYIPLLILGVHTITMMLGGHSIQGLLLIFLALNLFALVVCPLIAAITVKMSLSS